ncbi:MAG TPA: NAD-dependent epimerase/dehydratase family protein [Trueperaceae bacterium]
MTRLVVIGAGGFIGKSVASEAAEHPEFELVSAARKPGSGERAADLTAPETLRALICPGDVVVNCAGYANANDATVDGRRLLERVNVEGVVALAEACALKGARQLVHLSSVAAMGPCTGEHVTEADSAPPATAYAWSKLRAEQLLASYRDRLHVTVLRPTSVFGEGRGLARSLCRLVSLPVVPLPAGGRSLIPFCYVKNVAAAVLLCAGNPSCFGRTFVVGDERSYTLREIVLAFARALGKRPLLLPLPAGLVGAAASLESRLADRRNRLPLLGEERIASLSRSVTYSIDELRRATGYTPRYDLVEAADRIAAWYRREVQA